MFIICQLNNYLKKKKRNSIERKNILLLCNNIIFQANIKSSSKQQPSS